MSKRLAFVLWAVASPALAGNAMTASIAQGPFDNGAGTREMLSIDDIRLCHLGLATSVNTAATHLTTRSTTRNTPNNRPGNDISGISIDTPTSSTGFRLFERTFGPGEVEFFSDSTPSAIEISAVDLQK